MEFRDFYENLHGYYVIGAHHNVGLFEVFTLLGC
jgi:hypothetical protein